MAHVMTNAMRRLKSDLEELMKFPVANVSAAPLDDNMLEWHCNIRQGDLIRHVILFFPPEYPYKSPSAEFMPSGLTYSGGATKPGKKGTQICLSIFSDFADIHQEWANEMGSGWSPGYTVQTILMNLVSFLSEEQAASRGSHNVNLKLSQAFKCKDCGHTCKKPEPALDDDVVNTEVQAKSCGLEKHPSLSPGVTGEQMSKTLFSRIVDYVSKEEYKPETPTSRESLYGFGLIVSGPVGRQKLTTPCEYLSGHSFYGMVQSMGYVHSVLKENLSVFLPLYIQPVHGAHIRAEFERAMQQMPGVIINKDDPRKGSIEYIILKAIPNLMCSTVVEFSKGTTHTSENCLNGYFALHRLLLWALETYPGLQAMVESELEGFIMKPASRTKQACPDVGQWLMLLSASQKFQWQHVAQEYLNETQKRNVMWYVKDDPKLGFLDTAQSYRLSHTFEKTVVSRNLLAFQVVFLDVAIPVGMSRKDIVKRYDDNIGFPTEEMVNTVKTEFEKIRTEIHNFSDWYNILKLPAPSESVLFKSLLDAVSFAKATPGYHFGAKPPNRHSRR